MRPFFIKIGEERCLDSIRVRVLGPSEDQIGDDCWSVGIKNSTFERVIRLFFSSQKRVALRAKPYLEGKKRDCGKDKGPGIYRFFLFPVRLPEIKICLKSRNICIIGNLKAPPEKVENCEHPVMHGSLSNFFQYLFL